VRRGTRFLVRYVVPAVAIAWVLLPGIGLVVGRLISTRPIRGTCLDHDSLVRESHTEESLKWLVSLIPPTASDIEYYGDRYGNYDARFRLPLIEFEQWAEENNWRLYDVRAGELPSYYVSALTGYEPVPVEAGYRWNNWYGPTAQAGYGVPAALEVTGKYDSEKQTVFVSTMRRGD